jgi:nitrogen fixation protein FixH
MNYRYLIIGVLIVGLVIIGSSVYIGYAVRDVEVVDNAYEAGLKFDEIAKKRSELGWNVELPRTIRVQKATSSVVTVSVTDRVGAALRGATVDLELNRMGSREVRTYRCNVGKEGRYSAPVVFNKTGYWEARVHIARSGDSLVFDEQIDVVR